MMYLMRNLKSEAQNHFHHYLVIGILKKAFLIIATNMLKVFILFTCYIVASFVILARIFSSTSEENLNLGKTTRNRQKHSPKHLVLGTMLNMK